MVYKYINTPKITRLDLNNQGAGSYDTGSNFTALGSDLTPVAGSSFPTNVQVGSRAEITDSRKMYYRMDSDYETAKWYELGTLPYAGGRGVFGNGYNNANTSNIDYVTISTLGNSTDFGDMSVARRAYGATSNKTRGLFFGGYSSSVSNIIDYITVATPSNATDFGDIAQDGNSTHGCTSVGNNTRGFIAGGET